jgi:putative transcriptional regulator
VVSASLHSTTKLKPALRVSGEVYFTTDKELLEKTAQTGKDASVFRVYLGYAGWGPDQLEREMAADAWTVIPAKDETVFDAEPATLWDRLNKKSNLRIALAR